jgi:hypothetical protein
MYSLSGIISGLIEGYIMTDLKDQLLNAYLFLRKHNHTIPDNVLEFIKNSGELQNQYDALVLENTQLKLDHIYASQSQIEISKGETVDIYTTSFHQIENKINKLNNLLREARNQESRELVLTHVKKAQLELDNYDLSSDDLFKCEDCEEIFDIEDSIQAGGKKGKLICEICNK